jgi:hypothetical protein
VEIKGRFGRDEIPLVGKPQGAGFAGKLLYSLSTVRLRYASVGVVGVDSLDGKYGQKLD